MGPWGEGNCAKETENTVDVILRPYIYAAIYTPVGLGKYNL